MHTRLHSFDRHVTRWRDFTFSPKWSILRVVGGHETSVIDQLRERDINAYTPIGIRTRVHSRTKKKIETELPLFAGYVFARVRRSEWQDLRQLSGILAPLRLDGGKGHPATVPASLVSQLMEAQGEGRLRLDPQASNVFSIGDRVTVEVFGHWFEGFVNRVTGNDVRMQTSNKDRSFFVERPHTEFRAA